MFQFLIIRADDPAQRVIGTVGINGLVPAPNIGYGLLPEFWGLGYSSEAAGGLVRAWWALPRAKPEGQLNGEQNGGQREKLYASCNKENVGSGKVLEKNGFQVYEEVSMEGDIVVFWHLERED